MSEGPKGKFEHTPVKHATPKFVARLPDDGPTLPTRHRTRHAARRVDTSIAEAVHRRTQEFLDVGHFDTKVQMRLYHADFKASFHDLRGQPRRFTACYKPDSYVASQQLAQHLLAAGSNGILYDSVRHAGGECLACFRPALVKNVRVAAHYEFAWEGRVEPRVRRLT